MKTLSQISIGSYFITLFLFITIVYGALASLFLGAIHLITLLVYALGSKGLPKYLRNYLQIYAGLVICYFLGVWGIATAEIFEGEVTGIVLFFLTAMLIGGFFVYINFSYLNYLKTKEAN